MKYILYFVLCFLTFSCGSNDDDMPIVSFDCELSTGALMGKILDKDFELLGGNASYDMTEDEFQIFIFGTDEMNENDPCDLSGVQGSQITFFISNNPGEGMTTATTFNAETMEFQTSSVCYDIESISSTSIAGRLTIEDSNDGNEVSGSWDVAICN